MKKIFLSILLVSIFALILSSCKKDSNDEPTPEKQVTNEIEKNQDNQINNQETTDNSGDITSSEADNNDAKYKELIIGVWQTILAEERFDDGTSNKYEAEKIENPFREYFKDGSYKDYIGNNSQKLIVNSNDKSMYGTWKIENAILTVTDAEGYSETSNIESLTETAFKHSIRFDDVKETDYLTEQKISDYKIADVNDIVSVLYSADNNFMATGTASSANRTDLVKGEEIIIEGQLGLYGNGKIFVGWSTNKSDTEALYKEGDKVVINSTITLYSIWRDAEFDETSTYDPKYSSLAPNSADFTVSNSGLTATIKTTTMITNSTIVIDFGDGETQTLTETSDIAMLYSKGITHTYSSVGEYTIKLKAKNDYGEKTSSQSITIAEKVVSGFEYDVLYFPTSDTGYYVIFTNKSTNATKLTWNFGDDSAEEIMTAPITEFTAIAHTFTKSGTYTVKLTAEDDNGNKDVSTQTIEVKIYSTFTITKIVLSKWSSTNILDKPDPYAVILVDEKEISHTTYKSDVTAGSECIWTNILIKVSELDKKFTVHFYDYDSGYTSAGSTSIGGIYTDKLRKYAGQDNFKMSSDNLEFTIYGTWGY